MGTVSFIKMPSYQHMNSTYIETVLQWVWELWDAICLMRFWNCLVVIFGSIWLFSKFDTFSCPINYYDRLIISFSDHCSIRWCRHCQWSCFLTCHHSWIQVCVLKLGIVFRNVTKCHQLLVFLEAAFFKFLIIDTPYRQHGVGIFFVFRLGIKSFFFKLCHVRY